ncbi:YbaN family protein [Radiobacillus kanasensis]|uniref:YbaN family protein n=1 Tax=Radiobacillus kanasensis TaxID=2844358 RepID=UPI001E429848|nr:YbaN family protein [Radiobacillus kanasensis]UFU00292.1 YbaN family protein [Radiobacillus kanasensis]
MLIQVIKKSFLIGVGSISVGLGIMGIFLPLLPTTPFLLLAAFCYLRSSEKLYDWLMNQKQLNIYITSFRKGQGIPMKAKIISIAFIWASISISVFFINYMLIRIMLIAGAMFYTVIVLRQKTLKELQEEECLEEKKS